jgi:acyl-CoA synthetase
MRPFLTLHDPLAARGYYDQGLWRDETFYDLLVRHAGARPDAVALRDSRRSVSWGELKNWADGVAQAFADLGLAGGDRVSLWLSNRVEAVVVFLACARQGYACNPSLHRSYSCDDIAGLLASLGSAVLVTEADWGAHRDETDRESALTGVDSLRKIYTLETFPGPGEAALAPAGKADRVCYLAFTSGTTGQPKCVMHSANTLLANARDMVRDWEHGPETVLLTLSPLSHHIAWVAVAEWLAAGGTLVTDDPPDGASRLDWMIDTDATYVMGVPTHAIDILAEQKARGIPRLGSVRTFYMAGAPIPATVAEAFVAQGVKPQNVYGMTENSSHQYTQPDDDTETIVTTCGRGGPAYEIRLFDQEDPDKPVPVGEVGQIGGRGAALMLGYYGDQQATAASFNRDGWFLSGDLGVLDARGNLKVVGRLKDLIIRGGRNIHPAHIENLAVKHAAVEKAAAFAVADERLGEKVCLAILGAAEPQALIAHLDAEGLSLYDMPEYFLALDEFPLTPSGKILKRALSDMVKRGELAPTPVRFQAKKEPA